MTKNNNLNSKYCEPILRLADLCSAEGIPFIMRPLFNGLQLVCPDLETWELDVICHDYSYGHDSGWLRLLELFVKMVMTRWKAT